MHLLFIISTHYGRFRLNTSCITVETVKNNVIWAWLYEQLEISYCREYEPKWLTKSNIGTNNQYALI